MQLTIQKSPNLKQQSIPNQSALCIRTLPINPQTIKALSVIQVSTSYRPLPFHHKRPLNSSQPASKQTLRKCHLAQPNESSHVLQRKTWLKIRAMAPSQNNRQNIHRHVFFCGSNILFRFEIFFFLAQQYFLQRMHGVIKFFFSEHMLIKLNSGKSLGIPPPIQYNILCE